MAAAKTSSDRYKGVAMITAVPFDADGRVNADEYRRLIEHQIRAGISIVQCPLADELYYLSDDECMLVMKTLAEACKGKALSCAIASHSPSVDRIIENAKRYESIGIDIIKVLCPLHYGMDFTPEDVFAYYAQVIEAINVPVMIYNQPKRCGVNVPPAVIARLARDYAQVVMLEDTNFAQVPELKALVGKAVSIFVKFPFWISGSVLGCEGFYSWQPFAPALTQELSSLCIAGNHEEAKEMYFRRYDLYSLASLRGVPTMKLALREVGFNMGGTRKPLSSDVPVETQRQYRQALEKYRLIGTAR